MGPGDDSNVTNAEPLLKSTNTSTLTSGMLKRSESPSRYSRHPPDMESSQDAKTAATPESIGVWVCTRFAGMASSLESDWNQESALARRVRNATEDERDSFGGRGIRQLRAKIDDEQRGCWPDGRRTFGIRGNAKGSDASRMIG